MMVVSGQTSEMCALTLTNVAQFCAPHHPAPALASGVSQALARVQRGALGRAAVQEERRGGLLMLGCMCGSLLPCDSMSRLSALWRGNEASAFETG